MVFITFIIPSLGRSSINESIKSLYEQTDDDWSLIVIFDGIKSNIDNEIVTDKIKIIEEHKIGNAGDLRNIGMKEVDKNCSWIGFLDDDDYLSDDYIEKLKLEIENSKNLVDIVVFRMAYSDGLIIPSKNTRNILPGNIGISFAIQNKIENDITFTSGIYEDFIFLKSAFSKKYKIILSSYVTYFVRGEPYKCDFYPKIFLNF
jgi:glycosyltransferase involved in cell wall biosynthesis